MTEEPLNVEEPKEPKKPEADVDGLIAELERAGVTTTDELSGKLRASQETGRLAQLLGDERKARSMLEQRLQELEQKPAQRQQDYMDDYQTGQPIDIEAAIERSVSKVFTKQAEQQRKFQEENLKKWNAIVSDEDYALIKDVWDEKLKDPNFVYKVQNGVADPIQEYNSLVRQYYKSLLKKSHETITTMRGGPKEPPHMETGERTSANLVSESPAASEAEQKRKALQEKVDKGYLPTDEELLDLTGSIFDPILPIKTPPK